MALTPDELREARRRIELERGGAPFDLVAGGPARGDDWERDRAHARACAEAGATWYGEWVPPAEPAVMRAAVARGPLRIDESRRPAATLVR